MKVYLSVPMVANRSLERTELLAQTITRAGHEVTSRWVLGAMEQQNPTVVDVFHRDKSGAESCDILVADVSQPSIGVGMEIMAAYEANRRIVLVQKRGNVTSRMLLHMDHKELLEFDDDESLVKSLLDALRPVG